MVLWCIGCRWRVFCLFQAEDGIREGTVTGVQTCALPIYRDGRRSSMTRRRGTQTALALLLPAAVAVWLVHPAEAHEFALESLINGFVKIDAREAHLLVRVPLHVVATIKLPARGAEIDLANAGPAIQRGLEALGRDLILWEDGRRLVPASAAGRLSLPSDRSFERYERSEEHTSELQSQFHLVCRLL